LRVLRNGVSIMQLINERGVPCFLTFVDKRSGDRIKT
jgi:hypothetical protein